MPLTLEEPATLPLPGLPTIPEGRRPWKFCLNTSTIRGQKLPLDQVVEIAAAAGYDAIEPWIDELEAYEASGGDLTALREKIHDLGMTVESAIGFFEWVVDDDARRLAGLERARADMELLKRLGGKRIAAPPFGAHEAGSPPLDLRVAAEHYATLCDIGERAGVTPLCEVWGFSANLNTLAEGLFVASHSGHPNACLLLDSYHLYKGGSPLEGLRFLQGEKLPLFHINDWPDIPREKIVDGDRIWPGDGVAPLIPLLRTLAEIGFAGYLSLELFHPDYWAMDPNEAARIGRAKVQAVTEAAL